MNWFLNWSLTLATRFWLQNNWSLIRKFGFNINNHIFIMFVRIIVHFSIFIYHVSYPIILKINVSMYQIRVVSDTRIVSVSHKLEEIKSRKYIYIYIYIYDYLINCEYFNNLNEDEYYGGDMYITTPIPIPN